VGVEELDGYLKECVHIFPEQIQEEYTRIPADLAYWNAQYAEAYRKHLLSKIERNRVTGELYADVRQAIVDSGARPTEKMIEATVERDAEFVGAAQACAEAEADVKKLYGVLDAIRSKRDMLVSLGAHIRVEMMGDPVLREQMRSAHNKGGFAGG
jgi:hypothetical protein